MTFHIWKHLFFFGKLQIEKWAEQDGGFRQVADTKIDETSKILRSSSETPHEQKIGARRANNLSSEKERQRNEESDEM